MIKEKLMDALKTAAADYNGGMGANAAVAKAAEASDFNDKQTDRLVEMFNTAVALGQEKDANDPTGACELADKKEVAKMLLNGASAQKMASAASPDYSFYGDAPRRTSPAIEARAAGRHMMSKAASSERSVTPEELDVSQGSLFKIINEKIETLKSAADAADEAARCMRSEVDRESMRLAREIESPASDPGMADLFKAACHCEKAVANISRYSTKVAESDGGVYSRAYVYDSSPVDDMIKAAEGIEALLGDIEEYEKKRDFYMSKAAEAHEEMLEAVGLKTAKQEAPDRGLASMFCGVARKSAGAEKDDPGAGEGSLCMKIAELLRSSGVNSDAVADIADALEKEAAPVNMGFAVPTTSFSEAHKALTTFPGVDSEKKRMLNVRRAILLSKLMSDDPLIRDADPAVVTSAYKTLVMASPRVSLDEAQVRAFLRSAVSTEAISPNDAKVITDVDRGVSTANSEVLNRIASLGSLTSMDSSIKDSNKV